MGKVYLTKAEREVQAAWGSWLEDLASWKLFVTMTMRDRSRKDGQKYSPGIMACRRMWADFQGQARAYSSELQSVAVYELQPGREVYHVHALVAGPFERGISTALVGLRSWAWEKWGFNRIVKFLPSVGASGYLGKYLVKATSDVEFSANLGHLRGI